MIFRCDGRYYDGELDKIALEKKTSTKRPIPIFESFRHSKTEPSKVEEVKEEEDIEDDGAWPKHLPMFQVNAISLRSGLSLKTGTVLFLEAENKDLKARRKSKVITKNNNVELVARCRVYQKVGPLENQRVRYINGDDDYYLVGLCCSN